MSEKLSRDGLYPLADTPPRLVRAPGWHQRVRARSTGEKRPPRAGEWYLSGAKIEAYQARNDFESASYHIAELVEMQPVVKRIF